MTFYHNIRPILAVLSQRDRGSNRSHFREKTIARQDDLGGRKQKLTARNTEGTADRANGEKQQSGGGGLSGQTDRKTGAPSLIPEGEEISSACRENETLSARARRGKGSRFISKMSLDVSVFGSTLW